MTTPEGETLHVCEDGPRDAPALLLIHGSAASTTSWDPLVPLLTDSHRVIRVDLLGCGRSDKPADGDYTIPAQGRRVAVALDLLGVRQSVVVGHSSGGAAATALAEQRPDLVTALVLINTGPRMAAFIPQQLTIGPSDWPPSDEQVRRFASTGFSRPGYQVPQQFVDEVRGLPFHSFAGTMHAVRDYLEHKALPDRLAAVGRPLLVIFGEDDRRWRSSSAAEYRTVPGARVELLPGLGHSPNLEDPLRTAEHLLAFAATHIAPAD